MLLFFSGFCLGCFIAVLIFLTMANWRKPEPQDVQWLKDFWQMQVNQTDEKLIYLKQIATSISETAYEKRKGR